MGRYRKKPVVVEAERNDTKNSVFIGTLEGLMEARPGDYIITGVEGERYPCKPDIFHATYEDADAPDPAARLVERDAIIDALLARGLRHTTDCPVGKASYDNPDTCRCGLAALRARIEEARRAEADRREASDSRPQGAN